MEILVDYNNVLRVHRRKGLLFVLDTIIDALGHRHLGTEQRVMFRLYDGWYNNRTPTHVAQSVSTELQAQLPATRQITNGNRTTKLIVNAELAYSLKIDPSHHLWHTFRSRGFPQGLQCSSPQAQGCVSSQCPLAPMHSFFANDACPEMSCTIAPEQLVSRSEQKLVDAMLFADITFHLLKRTKRLVIVSSDDDMWPAIQTAIGLGMNVIHVHTHPGRRTPRIYSRGTHPQYTEVSL